MSTVQTPPAVAPRPAPPGRRDPGIDLLRALCVTGVVLLHAIMVGGFATIAGGVFALYVGFGVPAGHLMVASVMAVPAGLVCSKIMWPETESSETLGRVERIERGGYGNVIEAAAGGATRLTTETRVLCADAGSRRRFRVYWAVVRPGSGLIRRMMLRAVRREAERRVVEPPPDRT